MMDNFKVSINRTSEKRTVRHPKVSRSPSDETNDETRLVRRSSRKRTTRKIYVPLRTTTRRRKRKISDISKSEKKSSTSGEQEFRQHLARQISDTLTPIFTQSLNGIDINEEKEKKRAYNLRAVLKKAVELVRSGMIYSKSNGVFLVTSSDRSKTYTVRSTPMADRLHYTCNCGVQFKIGERVTCKHVFGVVISCMDSMVRMYYQFSTPESVQNIHDITELVSGINITPSDTKSEPSCPENKVSRSYTSVCPENKVSRSYTSVCPENKVSRSYTSVRSRKIRKIQKPQSSDNRDYFSILSSRSRKSI